MVPLTPDQLIEVCMAHRLYKFVALLYLNLYFFYAFLNRESVPFLALYKRCERKS